MGTKEGAKPQGAGKGGDAIHEVQVLLNPTRVHTIEI